MPDTSDFSPILSQHAIERCAASVVFAPPLPDKAFAKMRTSVADVLSRQGFAQAQPIAAVGFEFGPQGFNQLPATSMPQIFHSPTAQLQIAADSVSWISTSYVRWQPFIGEFERVVFPIVHEALDLVSIVAAKLEYWDRFIWNGDWENFDVTKLLKPDSPHIVPAVRSLTKQWHSHSGWFEKTDELRRLTNVNVDIVEIVNGSGIQCPSVGIYSAMTDQFNVQGYGALRSEDIHEQFATERLESQHLALKEILGHIISEDMANRIGLFSRKTNNNARD